MNGWRRWPAAILLLVLGGCAGEAGRTRSAPGAPREASASVCLGLDADACRADASCEAIPYWGESLVACDVDSRGFADNCPYEGCRPQGADCPSSSQLSRRCAEPCPYNNFGLDPDTGCRTCRCRGG